MKEKIKLGIPIENEATGEINIILRANEIRIIEEAFKEIERLNNIIKEVREYIEPLVELDNDIMLKGKMLKPVLEILDKGKE